MKEKRFTVEGRDYLKVTLPSGATIITDITIPDDHGPPTLTTYQLLLRIADKLGVDTTP